MIKLVHLIKSQALYWQGFKGLNFFTSSVIRDLIVFLLIECFWLANATFSWQAVDYEGIACSAKFEKYVRLSAELKRVDLSQLVPEQKIAFFINVYNALVIHAFVVQGPPTNTLARILVCETT